MNETSPPDYGTPASDRGLVLASHGILAVVEFPDGTILRCAQTRETEYAIVGDHVRVVDEGGKEPRVAEIEPRRRVLKRSSKRAVQSLVANVDRLVIVVAPVPERSRELIDRYAVAAEAEEIAPLIVSNKCDLGESPEFLASLEPYRMAGYDIMTTSAKRGDGLEALRAAMSEGTSVLAGMSGVGKSSLLNRLLGNELARTGEISRATGKGRHITTAATAYRLGNGLVVDTPGVRSYALADIGPDDLRFCFPEIRELQEECQFANCLHLDEPGCAARAAAAEEGRIAEERYQSYRKLFAELEQQQVEERGYGQTRHTGRAG